MGDAEQFVSEALQEGHSMSDIIEAMNQHPNPSLQGFAKNWNQVASQPTYQPGMGPASIPETTNRGQEITPLLTQGVNYALENPVHALGYGAGALATLGAGGVVGRRLANSAFDAVDAARSRWFPNAMEKNESAKTEAYTSQVAAQNAAAQRELAQNQAGSQAPEVDAHEEHLKEQERLQAAAKTRQQEALAAQAEAKLEALKTKGVKPEGKARAVSPQDQAILDAIARGNVKPVSAITPAPPPTNIGAPAPTAAPSPTAVATQQTAPIQSTENIAAETPKEQRPISNGNKFDVLMNVAGGNEQPQPVTSATETEKAPASVNQNTAQVKTALPEGGRPPPAEGMLRGNPNLPDFPGTKQGESFLSQAHGKLDNGVFNTLGPKGYEQAVLDNGGKRFGNAKENYQSELNDILKNYADKRKAAGEPLNTERSVISANREALKQQLSSQGLSEEAIKAEVNKVHPYPSNAGSLAKVGAAGALIGLANIANAATSKERANALGETAMGLIPSAGQALLYSKEAGAPTLDVGSIFEGNAKARDLEKTRPGFMKALSEVVLPKGMTSEGKNKRLQDLIDNPPAVFTDAEKLQSEMQKRSARGGRIIGAISPPSRK